MKILRLLPVLSLMLTFASCFDAPKPLSDPSTAAIDMAILGVWIGNEEGDETCYRATPMTAPWILVEKAVYRPHKGDFQPQEIERYKLFSTQAQTQTFFNVQYSATKPGGDRGNPKDVETRYTFIRYAPDGAKLNLYFLAYEPLRDALRKKLIHGVALEGTMDRTVRFEDPSAKLLETFLTPEGNKLFSQQLTLTRPKDAAKSRACRKLPATPALPPNQSPDVVLDVPPG